MKKDKKKPAIIRIILDYIKSYKKYFIFAMICIVFTALGNIVAPIVLQKITNILASWATNGTTLTTQEAWHEITIYLIVLASVYVVSI